MNTFTENINQPEPQPCCLNAPLNNGWIEVYFEAAYDRALHDKCFEFIKAFEQEWYNNPETNCWRCTNMYDHDQNAFIYSVGMSDNAEDEIFFGQNFRDAYIDFQRFFKDLEIELNVTMLFDHHTHAEHSNEYYTDFH